MHHFYFKEAVLDKDNSLLEKTFPTRSCQIDLSEKSASLLFASMSPLLKESQINLRNEFSFIEGEDGNQQKIATSTILTRNGFLEIDDWKKFLFPLTAKIGWEIEDFDQLGFLGIDSTSCFRTSSHPKKLCFEIKNSFVVTWKNSREKTIIRSWGWARFNKKNQLESICFTNIYGQPRKWAKNLNLFLIIDSIEGWSPGLSKYLTNQVIDLYVDGPLLDYPTERVCGLSLPRVSFDYID